MTQDPDVKLMLAFQNGDEGAFITLYESYRNQLVNFTRRFLGDQAQGEEAAQDVFLKLYRARDSYKPASRFSTYLYRIASNHCINMVQKHDHKLVARDRDFTDQPQAIQSGDTLNPEEQATTNRKRIAIQQALGKLKDNQRAALLLCHYQGLSYQEASNAMDISESAMKSLLFRARESLGRELQRVQFAA